MVYFYHFSFLLISLKPFIYGLFHTTVFVFFTTATRTWYSHIINTIYIYNIICIYCIWDERIICIICIYCIILYYKYFSTVDISWTMSTSVHYNHSIIYLLVSQICVLANRTFVIFLYIIHHL